MQACRLLRAFAREPLERIVLVLEEAQAKLRIPERIAAAVAQQFVILDQPVVRVLRKGDRRKLERIDGLQPGEDRVPEVLVQDRQVMLDDVVAEHERGARRDSFKCRAQLGIGERPAESYLFIGVGAPRGELVDRAQVVARRLEIEAQALRPERARPH